MTDAPHNTLPQPLGIADLQMPIEADGEQYDRPACRTLGEAAPLDSAHNRAEHIEPEFFGLPAKPEELFFGPPQPVPLALPGNRGVGLQAETQH